MAYDTLRASGNNQYGQMSDVERASFGSQQNAADWILRKKLQDEMAARAEAQQSAGLSAQERMQERSLSAQERMGGTFADRKTAEDERLTRMLSPQEKAIAFQREQYLAERGDKQPSRDYENEIVRQRMEFLKGGGGFSDPKIAERARYRVIAGGDLPSDPVDELLKQMIPALIAQSAQGGDLSQVPGLIGALKSGDLSQLPTQIGPKPTALGLEDVKGMALGRARKFGEKDASFFGWNPTDSDVADLVRQRDELARAIKAQQPRLPDEEAVAAANSLMDQELEANAGRVGTGWIEKARQALGVRPGSAPAIRSAVPGMAPSAGGPRRTTGG